MKNERKPLSKQVIEDYDKELQENDHMNKLNAIRNVANEWNMPYSVVKNIIENR